MYSIGQVSEMFGIPVSTLRYYDKEGLFPNLERSGSMRRFGEGELELLRVIDCLKKTGLEIRDIKRFVDMVQEGPSTYAARKELFEARKPKKTSFVAEKSGTAFIHEAKKMRTVKILPDDGSEPLEYSVPFGTKITIEDGQYLSAGDDFTEGYKSPADILRINGIDAVYDYIIREVQRVYRSQSININDKHIEVITRQMTRKVKVEDSGSTQLLSGSTIDLTEFLAENEAIQARIDAGERDLLPATSSPVLLGITKASLLTESFLSAASFQETTKVLTEAAIKGKVDHLMGLKENVIIGKLIPAGTGIEQYRSVRIEDNSSDDAILNELSMVASLSEREEEDEDDNLPNGEGDDFTDDELDDEDIDSDEDEDEDEDIDSGDFTDEEE